MTQTERKTLENNILTRLNPVKMGKFREMITEYFEGDIEEADWVMIETLPDLLLEELDACLKKNNI